MTANKNLNKNELTFSASINLDESMKRQTRVRRKEEKEKERTMEIIIQCQVCLGQWQHDIYLGGLFSLNFNHRSPLDKLSYKS